ncbi:Hypothetical predicted protein [Pelobates cultripes]|uniref:Uncharacterized protein n=1 Tax=Pelobates cultripes TaxID=61616 RepID=A0AAD1RTC4_PELCU|nr:Hypothetical predicted protein [Pelobates cultripes]
MAPKQHRESTKEPNTSLTNQADYTARLDKIFAAFWRRLARRLRIHAEISRETHPSLRPRGGHKMADAQRAQQSKHYCSLHKARQRLKT